MKFVGIMYSANGMVLYVRTYLYPFEKNQLTLWASWMFYLSSGGNWDVFVTYGRTYVHTYYYLMHSYLRYRTVRDFQYCFCKKMKNYGSDTRLDLLHFHHH